MPHYKAPDDSVHFLDSVEFEYLLPLGSVGITDAEAAALVPHPSVADFKAMAVRNVRVMRVQVFATLAGIQAQALANSDAATAKAISDIQNQLKRLPDVDLSACNTPADIDAVFVAEWKQIAAMAPSGVETAFNEVLS